VRKSEANALVVLGPTASGKTQLGVRLARRLGGEIISADSRQVYRGLNLGAGKDLDEYRIEGVAVPYHLIDVVDLDREFSVFDYQQLFFEVFVDLRARQILPIIVGGTGLYLEAALRGYGMVKVPENPTLRNELAQLSHEELVARLRKLKSRPHNVTDLNDRARLVRAIEIALHAQTYEPPPAPDVRALILGMQWGRSELHQRIRHRLLERLERGMVEEVRGLLDQGVPAERLISLGLEYRYVTQFIRGEIRTRNDLVQKLASAIINFAKRQETWFRRMERGGMTIHWAPRADFDIAKTIVSDNGFRT